MSMYKVKFDASAEGLTNAIECFVEADNFIEAIHRAEAEAQERYADVFGEKPGELAVKELIRIV